MTTPNTTTIPVTFIKQGGKLSRGTAIGRKGNALLVQYKINDGSDRERWIPGNRIKSIVAGNVEDLPRYIGQKCPGTKFEKPVTEAEFGYSLVFSTRSTACKDANRHICEKCGEAHGVICESDWIEMMPREIEIAYEKYAADWRYFADVLEDERAIFRQKPLMSVEEWQRSSDSGFGFIATKLVFLVSGFKARKLEDKIVQ